MSDPIKPDQEPIIETESPSQDISTSLRQALEESREVSYEEYGEKKVVSVKHGNKTYKFYRDFGREYSDWAMDIYDEKDEFVDSVDVREDADVEYLEKLFEQDISTSLRQALEESREVSYEEYGEKKVVSVKHGNKTYKFYRDFGREYSDWAMDIYDEKDEFVDSVDVREDADVEYLEKLFEQDISTSLRQALEESREVSYEEYGEKKVVSVKHGNKTYKFYRDFGREYSDWAMDIYDEKDEFVDSVDVREDADVEYLEKLFEQDISTSLRQALEESREVSYEEYGEKKVVSVKHGNKTYKFYRDFGREYSDWAMDIYDEKDEFVDSVDVREDADVEYLEKLFEKPTKEEQIQAIKDKL
jgi:preprotein translocase subunit SecE